MCSKICGTQLKLSSICLQILFVRGQGFLAFGQSVEEAFHYAYHAVRACEIQV